MGYTFDWVDAFTAQAFGGNGCAVLHDAGDLGDQICMKIVRETSLVECTFVEPSQIADFKVRYFVASREIPFAGHPTIATVASLISRGAINGDHARLETGAGVIEIDIDQTADGPPMIFMTQMAPVFGTNVSAASVAEIIGLTEADVAGAPQVVSTGLPFVITLLKDHDALRRAQLNAKALAQFQQHSDYPDADVMEPYLVALGGADTGDTFARLLLAPPMPPEDPFTGSATGAAASYLWKNAFIDAPNYVAEQGHWMGRPGRAQVEVLGPREAISGVRVGGQGYVLMSGEMRP